MCVAFARTCQDGFKFSATDERFCLDRAEILTSKAAGWRHLAQAIREHKADEIAAENAAQEEDEIMAKLFPEGPSAGKKENREKAEKERRERK